MKSLPKGKAARAYIAGAIDSKCPELILIGLS